MTQKMKWILILVAIAGAALTWRWLAQSRIHAEDAGSGQPKSSGIVAAVAPVRRGSLENSLTISGAFKPFQEVDVHAKVSGYVRKMYVDVGDRVKEGQTLAVLEVPELAAELAGATAAVRRSEDEIRRAQSDLQRAKSSHSASHAMFERLNQAAQQKSGLVAQQEIDNAQAKDLESEAQVSSDEAALSSAEQALQVADANQKQFKALSNYMQITAPFAGVITSRYADTGALLAAGTSSSAQALPIVRLAEVSKLRLVLPIPESIAAQIHLDDSVRVNVQALGRVFVGKVSRFAGSLDSQTRTMETEIDFDNRDGKLMPGMFGEAVLQLANRNDVLLIPLEAVSEGNGEASVLVVNAHNIVEQHRVQLGFQGKSEVEVLSGLAATDRVVIGNRSQFRTGEKVVPKIVQLPSMEKGEGN